MSFRRVFSRMRPITAALLVSRSNILATSVTQRITMTRQVLFGTVSHIGNATAQGAGFCQSIATS
jgi:hypothetical protein